MKFEIKDRDAAGRICKFTTNHGTVTTPTLLPVINPNKMLISPKEMKKLFGTEIVITNSYIISKDKKLKVKALEKGVHKLIDFNGSIMTDSGTFQSYVYGDINVDPIEIVEFQRDIGTDIGTILDVFSTPDQKKSEVEQIVKETVKRAKKSVEYKGNMALACTVQGSIYPEVREKCAKQLSEIESDFFPIGGVVPLMENQRYTDLIRCIIFSKKGLDPSKPVHLFGAGHPLIFPLAVALGCDFFDSSAYVKYANDERFLFSWGTEKLDNLKELPCNCPICSKYSASELSNLDKKNKTLEIAKHNLYITYNELKKIRNAISNGSLWELVERRANSNPYLLESLKELRNKENKDFLEQFEPISKKKSLFYSGSHTIHRPDVYRVHKRILSRYKEVYKTTIVFPDGTKPYSIYYSDKIKKIFKRNCKINILIDSHIGPVPLELDEMYPFAQSIFPEVIDIETEEYLTKIIDDYTKNKNLICWKGSKTLNDFKSSTEKCKDFDILRISAISDFQFGKGAGKELLSGKVRVVKSKKTKKIRNVYCNEKHILSMRAEDGMFTLKLEGGKILHKFFKYPKLRVVINSEAAEFVKEGKSVFSKFVIDCDPDLRPFDECLIVNEKDELVAVGRCILNQIEMLKFNYGMAVKTREACIEYDN
jgi:7-cyano-7-deazaguanine tRNA-ribosyltransferase